MNDEHTKRVNWQQKVAHEVIEYWIMFGYIAFFLVALIWYRRLILAQYNIQYTEYWFPLIEAAVLAKVIMIGDFLGLGRSRRLEHKPLILKTLYQTLGFSLWVGLFSLLEKTVRGLFHGNNLIGGVEEILHKGPNELLSWCIVAFVTFIPFFAFRELERVLGKERIRALFWRKATASS